MSTVSLAFSRGHLLQLAVLLVILSASSAAAQVSGLFPPDESANPSHQLLPGGLGNNRDSAEDRLADRLRRSRDVNTTMDLLQNILKDPERYGLKKDDLARLAKEFGRDPGKMGIDPNDPKWKNLFREAQKKNPFTPEQLESLKRVIGDPTAPDKPNPEGTPPDKAGENPENPTTPPNNPPPDGSKPPSETNPTPPTTNPSTGGPEGNGLPPSGDVNPSWLSKLTERIRGEEGMAGDMRRRLTQLVGPDSRVGTSFRGLTEQTRQMGARLLPRVSDLPINRLLRDVAPNLSVRDRLGAPSSPSLSTGGLSGLFSGGAGGTGSGLGSVVFGLVALGAFGFLLWYLRNGVPWAQKAEADRWRLGAWPVQPESVRTRSDIVQAFEYLAMMMLGRKVTSAHHLAIAERLGTRQEDPSGRRQNAANELALLYEHARYAPPEEELSEEEMFAARRDLTLLAGVASA